MKILSLFLLLAAAALAQTTPPPVGVIQVSAPVPGVIIATAGAVSCTLQANSVPATAMTVTCKVGTSTDGPTTYLIPAGTILEQTRGFNGDLVTFAFSATALPGINWKVAATPNGGIAATNASAF